jgi:predicted AAA+ superfamily ATPase
LHLRRRYENLCYFNTDDGKEVDLVPVAHGAPQGLYQVSVTLKEASTRKREMSALQMAMQQLEYSEGWIITLDEEEQIAVPEGKINVVPLWKWLT